MRRDSRFAVRTWQEGDDEVVLALHRRAFNETAPRSLEHWNWKFHGNYKNAAEMAVAMNEDGECVAVYAGVPHRCVLDGEECRASVHVDMAVDPRLRGGIGGGGLLVSVGQLYFDTYANGVTQIGWGFPEPALQRMCLRYLKVGVLRDIISLVRDPASPLRNRARGVETHRADRFGADVDELWKTCSAEVNTGTIRDAWYLNWRYADHPDVQHVLLEARDEAGGGLRGVAVLREGGYQDEVVSLMDWLAPLKDVDAEAALLERALEETVRRGKRYLTCWFPATMPQFQRFQLQHDFFVVATPFQVCYRSWVRTYKRRWLDRNWYQTMGDIDFF